MSTGGSFPEGKALFPQIAQNEIIMGMSFYFFICRSAFFSPEIISVFVFVLCRLIITETLHEAQIEVHRILEESSLRT
jgi:hypothetical protein